MTASTVAQYLAALPADRRGARHVFPAALGHLSVSEFQFSAFSLSVRGQEGETKEVAIVSCERFSASSLSVSYSASDGAIESAPDSEADRDHFCFVSVAAREALAGLRLSASSRRRG
jgi:hypothetical protein